VGHINKVNEIPVLFTHFQQYFSYIMATSFSGGGSRSTWREPPTLGKQLVSFITCDCRSSAPFVVTYKAGREPQFLRNVCRYQRGNQKSWIEGQTTQWPKEKFVDTKGVIRSRKFKDRRHTGQNFYQTWLYTRLIWCDFWCLNATFSNSSAISWGPVLVVEEAGVHGENHRLWESNW
jgi:hypothetical protein